MSIDERLEKLTERHEALTQTVELLAMEQRAMSADNKVLGTLVREISGGIRDLVAVVRSHEQRLSNLES